MQFSPVAYLRWSLWRLAIHKFIKIFYRDFWLAWLFWFLTWSLTLWFIILPKLLRSLPTSRRDHFLLLCSRELLIWAKLAAARKSGFWADCSGERGGGSCKLVINLTINIIIKHQHQHHNLHLQAEGEGEQVEAGCDYAAPNQFLRPASNVKSSQIE